MIIVYFSSYYLNNNYFQILLFLILASTWLIYLHENKADMGSVLNNAIDMAWIMNVNVLMIEYPEYGIYKRTKMNLDYVDLDNLDWLMHSQKPKL